MNGLLVQDETNGIDPLANMMKFEGPLSLQRPSFISSFKFKVLIFVKMNSK